MSTTAPTQSPPNVANVATVATTGAVAGSGTVSAVTSAALKLVASHSVALTADELKELPQVAGHATPTQAVTGVAKQAAAVAATTWLDGKQVVSQWTINQDRNTWMGVAGIGWQKLSSASDSGCVALTMLASSALLTKATMNYRREADGMVHEIYLW